MHSQPLNTPTTEPTHRTTGSLIFLWIAGVCISATGLAILSWLDAEGMFTPPRVFGSFLASGVAVCGCGVIVQLAVEQITRAIDQVMHRMDQIEAQSEERRQEDYATAFVAGASGGRHLQAVSRG